MKIVIISGGSLDYDFAACYIQQEMPDCLIAADRGMKFCYEKEICPDYVLGDFDSIEPEIVSYFRKKKVEVIGFLPEKDDTDTEIAMKKAIDLGADQIVLLGALGGRMDHCIANLHMLKLAVKQQIDAVIVDRQNRIRLLDHSFLLAREKQWGKYVSFLPFTNEVENLTLQGFKYPLENYRMEKGLSIGVSNEIEEEQAEIRFTGGILMMIESKD